MMKFFLPAKFINIKKKYFLMRREKKNLYFLEIFYLIYLFLIYTNFCLKKNFYGRSGFNPVGTNFLNVELAAGVSSIEPSSIWFEVY
jgi:hypothetical protein